MKEELIELEKLSPDDLLMVARADNEMSAEAIRLAYQRDNRRSLKHKLFIIGKKTGRSDVFDEVVVCLGSTDSEKE